MKALIKFIVSIFLIIFLFNQKVFAQDNIKIGLIVPLSGEYKEIGHSIIKSTRLAINKINDPKIEIYQRDNKADPKITLSVAKELRDKGVKIIIGPVFNENLSYLEELNDIIFLSLTNKIIKNPKNIITTGINATSQINTIKKFLEMNEIKKTVLMVPNSQIKFEIEEALSSSKIKIKEKFIYSTDPTILTSQIEDLTFYDIRRQNLEDEITRLKNSNDLNKERKIKNLEKKHTLGGINFDSVIIADFDESLKSVATSLLYTDVSSKRIYYICLNQWFDQSLLNETDLQPLYYPSINKENFDNYKIKYFNAFTEDPNHLSLLSYDLVGLIYYLSLNSNIENLNKIFKRKNSFKGKIGIFDIKNNKINHRLNFYKVENQKLTEIF